MKDDMSNLPAGCVDAYLTAMAADRKTAGTKPLPLPDNPEDTTNTDLRRVIYCEVGLFKNSDDGIAGVYNNTSALNNSADVNYTCPADARAKVAVDSLEGKFDILSAYRNGTRSWTMDTITLPVGPVEAFDGLQARWIGQSLLAQRLLADLGAYGPLRSAAIAPHFEHDLPEG
jgi:hypothetical protein